ncbi:spore-associated protein A [Kitasatospora sp. NPDC085879]|uniref:spore-associated protein A n=1 Tax=Kitasatospora sp. NPDC085879 TaxID=3154769 RepID=UPI00344331A8
MHQRLKRTATRAGVMAAVAAAAVTVMPTAAHAATYNGACGSGYGVIDSGAVTGGTVFLTYNRSTGKNCVVTVRNTAGGAKYMAARVSKANDPWNSDEGQYTTYAGPVYVSAPGTCIDWGGEIDGSTYYRYGVHCG